MSSIDEVLYEQRAYAKEHWVPIIEPDAAEFLADVVKENQPLKILEIGTAIGYSGLLMLKASPRATLVTVDIDKSRLDIAEAFFPAAGVKQRVKIIEEDANYLLTLLEDKFDFVLLDGPKAHYSDMLEYLLQLICDDSIIFVDDVGYHGWVDDGSYPKHKHRTIITNMRAFIDKVNADDRVVAKRYDLGQGVMIIKKCTNPNC